MSSESERVRGEGQSKRAVPGLRSRRFRVEREADWRELERLLRKIDRFGTRRLTDDELLALPTLYRSALSSLSVARATSLDQSVIVYLESLSERAYYSLYGTKPPIWKRALYFLKTGWPEAVRAVWPELLISFSILLLACLLSLSFVLNDPEWFYSFADASLAGERTPAATREQLLDVIYTDPEDASGLGIFATALFSHNSGIAILAFALGFAFGIPTIILLIQNGLMLGAFIALHIQKGLGYEIGGWLTVHGTTEIFAIVLAGAGGLHIGRSVAFPRQLSRLQSAAKAGDVGGRVLGGVVIMLFVAGLLEAYPRQLISSDEVRYIIGLTMLALWLAYFFVPRRNVGQASP